MEQYFEESGYTYADYEADKELDNAEKSSDKPVFNVNMVYRLEGEDLVVEIPLAELEGKDEYPIYSITPLPFFGAGGKEDDGYLLVPEGGGAIINFNNGKLSQNSYYANLYGWDMALGRDAVVHNTRIYYNTFGISEGDDSFLCIMEEGVPYAAVQADISGHFNSYNYANVAYSITPREQYDVSEIANSSVYTYLKQLPDETLTQRYRFVDSGSYVDMAKIYQSYLKDKYTGYFTMNEDTQAPVTVEIVGAVDKVKQIVGLAQLIHSVDSVELMSAISREAEKKGIVQDILLEVNVAGEASKSGIAPENLPELLEKAGDFPGLRVRGLMAVPPICRFPDENLPYFNHMHQLFIDNGAKKYDNVAMDFMSMGMSGDYQAAISCGANMIRLGTAIFGKRLYPEKKV